ncbi:hypothetical protein WJX84_004464 [Apatococcus fuscideae]|uniref:AMP-activated protein kinase glycogen-binding domain-containing protein n=1 Tax=Apatococcus fuscideae TaxID=2026836 RepID=A0AAW1S5A1_9CHLO
MTHSDLRTISYTAWGRGVFALVPAATARRGGRARRIVVSASNAASSQAVQRQLAQRDLAQQANIRQPKARSGIRPLINNASSVDRRMYEQVVASRRRITERLSTANQYNSHLRSSLASRQAEVASMHALLLQLAGEFGSLKRNAQGSAASAYYSLDKELAVAQMVALADRITAMQQVLQSQADSIHKHAVRSVPIAWYGVASEVLLMGSFDGWTHGATLSAEDIGDSVFTRFQTDLQLLPDFPESAGGG